MYVSPKKQIYKCFSCEAGGDCFSFVMNYHKMSFPEALQYLAERAGIQLPRRGGGGGGDEGPSPRQQAIQANTRAQQFFRGMLADEQRGAIARKYLAERGIGDDMVEAFGIGYAPDEWDAFARAAQSHGADRKPFVTAGLINERSSGMGYYDRFRHRLMFPICDAVGRPIAFGGRVLPGSQRDDSTDAKYLNSPENPAFNKSGTLFGLHLASKQIIKTRTVVVVEGYTDVIACHQAGETNVVATLGTAMTAEHARTLRRFCDRGVLIFDADEAGLKAADRAVELFFQEPLDVSIAVLGEGQDPAELLSQEDGVEQWRAAVAGATDAIEFQLDRLRLRFDDTRSMAGRRRLAEEYLQSLVRLGFRQLDPVRRSMVLPRLAQMLGVEPATVRKLLQQVSAGPRSATPQQVEHHKQLDRRTQVEREIVGCLLLEPGLVDAEMSDHRPLSESIAPGDLADHLTQRVFERLIDWLQDYEALDAADVRSAMRDDEELTSHAQSLQKITEMVKNRRQTVEDRLASAVTALHEIRSRDEYEQQKLALREQAEQGEVDDATKRLLELTQRHGLANPSTRRLPRVAAD